MLRRACNVDGTPIQPMTLGNMRSLGVRTVDAVCGETLGDSDPEISRDLHRMPVEPALAEGKVTRERLEEIARDATYPADTAFRQSSVITPSPTGKLYGLL